MIETIEDLRNLDAEISIEFRKAINHLRFLLLESDFKNTADICFTFMTSTDFLKDSIFNCAENNNFYSINVLYRSINEHLLRFKYFWFNNSSYEDDSYALLFRVSLEFSEKMILHNALYSANQIKSQEIKTSDEIWKNLQSSNKEFQKFTKGEINEFSKNLSIKNVIRYLERTFKNNGYETNTYLQKSIIEYTQLSSFVHGGIQAHKDLVRFETSENKEKIFLDTCGPALQMATSIKIFSYLAIYQFMPEFGEIYNNTQELMKKIKP